MYIKITRSGDKSYVQLAESYRNEQGKPRQRVVANLGRLDESSSQANAILAALLKASGQPAGDAASLLSTVQFEAARSLGDVWALTVIWKQLGLDRLRQVLGQRSRHRIDLEALLRLMVMNRLCDADSKLGTLRWAQTVSLPDMTLDAVSHQHLLRAMDALVGLLRHDVHSCPRVDRERRRSAPVWQIQGRRNRASIHARADPDR